MIYKTVFYNIKAFFKWLVIAVLMGVVIGAVGALFHHAIELVTQFRIANNFVVALLPVGGLAIVLLYHFAKMDNDEGTNTVLKSVSTVEIVPPLWQAPLIFISTVITHLFGGSAGREGAALQLGGSIGNGLSGLLRLDKKQSGIVTMCGMSAGFSALFGTPVTAAVFAMEVASIGVMHYAAIVPCVISAVVGTGVASLLGVHAEAFVVSNVPQMNITSILQIVLLGGLCALLSVFFCGTMHQTQKLYEKYISNKYIRIFVGGIVVAVLTFVLGTGDYNGAGMNVIEKAVEGDAFAFAFLLKIIFTALTLGAGYKGGEIVPTLFIGATFGAVVAPFLGLSPQFGASVGMIALFCGVTNCPVSSVFLSIELFGATGLPLYATAVAVSYMLSGYGGLYSSQKILYSKFEDRVRK